MEYFKIAQLVLGLMTMVKSMKKTGVEKKDIVVGATKAAVSVMGDVSTGGQKETWEELEAPLTAPAEEGGLIETFYNVFFEDDNR